uniref:uncharacterized protein n=1 Tax=Centroberyx gerrardi TaxID=166262 RepID=UPI003AAEB020
MGRKKVFKLGAPKIIADAINLSTTGDRKSAQRFPTDTSSHQLNSELRPAPTKSFPSPTPEKPRFLRPERPEANIQSDFAYLPDVSVTCSTSDFVLRVKTAFYGLGANAEELNLGSTCKSNGVLRPYGDLLFTYPLTECDAQREMPPGYLVYKFVLHYAPSSKRFPSRAHRIDVNIECRFQRYHHVYQLAVRPTWQTAIVRKRLKGRPNDFQIQLMDDSWTRPAKSQVYQLGQTVNFQVSAPHLPSGGKLYINSCYAALFSGSKSSLKYTIIDNFGCLLESQRDPGGARFLSPRTDKTLRFSLSAFQFTADPDTQVHIHCKLFVTSEDPSPAYKSCTYRENRWKALTGDNSICECCDSQCVTPKARRAMMEGSASSGPMLVSDEPHTPEDGFLPVNPSLVSMRREGELEDILVFDTKMNHQIDELHSPEDQWDNTDEEEYDYDDGDDDQQSYTYLEEEEEEKQLEEESRVTLEEVEEPGSDKLGFRGGLFVEERETSGVRDLEEFGEDGSGYIVTEEFLEREEEESGSKIESEREGSELRALEGREGEVSDEKQLVHPQEDAEPPHGVEEVEQILVPEIEVNSQLIKTWREDKVQPPETESKEEEKRKKYIGRGEEAEKMIVSKIEWKDDDGPLEAGAVDGREMTWYFTWR